jgi:UDP-N-acetylglucosamine/UDP-N-acetylgalactosamine diphosphorylase
MNKIEEARRILEENGQGHIKVKNEELADQILHIDFERLKTLDEEITHPCCTCNIEDISPVKAINPDKKDKKELEEYIKIGENVVKSGHFAIGIMAGGQGTRLGHNGPKGTFKLELNGETKSLFEIIVDKLKDAYEKYNVYLNCYIMTSPENNKETVAFFEKNNYFNYPKEYIKFFMQEDLPLLNKKGKLILGEDGLIKLASEGNGGIFYSMAKKGIIDDMKSKNIKWIFIGSVDNLLVKYVDTLLLGLAIKQNVNIATRTVIKNSPNERVGVLCKKNGKVKVIEYTEVPKEMRVATDEAGEFLYGESHIMCNLFSLEAIEKASTKELKYHVAVKKIKYIDENGKLVNPTEPNCYKFEKFVFDSFGLFDEIAILRGKREEDFAPIKNAEGQDSPETAQKLYENYMAKNV